MKNFLKRHSLGIGILLMFLYTWTIDLSNSGILPFQVPFAIALTVGWGFVLVSLLMTWVTLGKVEAARLFKRFFLWRVHYKWWLVALCLLPALQLVAVLLTAWLTRVPPDFSRPPIRNFVPFDAPWLALILSWLIFEILTNGEEMGWRGYILPRLQARHNALLSSLIVGALWSVWHLPKFLGTGGNSEKSFFWFTLALLALAILFTWLYNNTRGSLLVVLFHAANNTAAMFLPVEFAAAGGIEHNILTLEYIIAATLVVLGAGATNLSRIHERQMQA